jgi:hypothetical protein
MRSVSTHRASLVRESLSSTSNLQNLQDEFRSHVLYNYNKYLYKFVKSTELTRWKHCLALSVMVNSLWYSRRIISVRRFYMFGVLEHFA